jgi:hypothetical protein
VSRKILKHPDKEQIIEWLSDGESVRSVEAKLKEKYPNNKKLWLTSVTLQTFRKKHLQLEGKVLQDIQEAREVKQRQIEEAKRQKQLVESDAYKKKINEIADSKLDVAQRILQLDRVIESRIEYWYNAVASGEESAAKGDRELRQFLDRQMANLAQYKKFVEGLNDKSAEYNLNVTVINDQISILRDVVRDCIAEFEPDVAAMFMEKLNRRLNQASYRPTALSGPAPQVNLKELQEAEFEVLSDNEPKE